MPVIEYPSLVADPWRIELIVVKGAQRSSSERSAVARDVERGLLHRLGSGVYIERAAFDAFTPEQAHIVRMRALTTTSPTPVTFSHWSAAVVLGLPVLRRRLDRLHTTVSTVGERRGRGVADHVFALREEEVVRVHGVSTTVIGRTVVDIAGAALLEEGVMAADAVLRAGHPRGMLVAAADLAGPRRSSPRAAAAVAFAHAGAESPAESRTRVTAYRIGVEIPELQRRVVLDDGRSVFLDEYFPDADAALEVDGDTKYRDAAMAGAGAAAAVIAEKRREDEVRTHLRALGRIGWAQSGNTALLRPVLGRIGVHPLRQRRPFDDWCAAAAEARPRRFP